MKGSPARFQLVLLDSEFVHRILVQDVDAASIGNQHSGEPDIYVGSNKYRTQHECVSSRIRHYAGMIRAAPADRLIRPVHEEWHCQHNIIYLHVATVQALSVY